MTTGRAFVLAVLALGLTGAGARDKRPATLDLTPAPEQFPTPPIPPTQSRTYQYAPMPNSTVTAPAAAERKGAKLRPDILNQRTYNGGQGYVYGSTIERQQEQRQKPVPGLNLLMPLP